MASGIAADLTEAYRVLMDPALRTAYDEQLNQPSSDRGAAPRPAPHPPAPPPRPEAAAPPPPPSPSPAAARPVAHAGTDLVRRATLAKVRDAVATIAVDSITVPGFDAAFEAKPSRGLFKKGEPGLRLLVKFVPKVDPESVAEAWPAALKAGRPEQIGVVLLMGSGLAPAGELAAAVAEHRRRARGAGPVLVPVDVRDWDALFPPDTPAAARALIQRLRAGE
jgi:hypothetical protein